jgi:hypothetical protein
VPNHADSNGALLASALLSDPARAQTTNQLFETGAASHDLE